MNRQLCIHLDFQFNKQRSSIQSGILSSSRKQWIGQLCKISALSNFFFKAHRIISYELGRLKSITADQFEPLSVMYVESELKETLGRRAALRNWPTLRKWRNVTWLGNVAARHKSVGKIREKGKYLSFPDEDNDDARFAASSHRRWNRP